MLCEFCKGSTVEKPIKFFWKDGMFQMLHEEETLLVSEHLGLEIPEGISNFEICLYCFELITFNPEDIDKYLKLTKEIKKSIELHRSE